MKKAFSLIGIFCGAAMFVFGLLMMKGMVGGDTARAHYSSLEDTHYNFYDSGYATFGADFYTYVTNNAAEAAHYAEVAADNAAEAAYASRTAANNLDEIATLIKNAGGVFFMAIGAFSVCLFGCKFCEPSASLAADPAAVAEKNDKTYYDMYYDREGTDADEKAEPDACEEADTPQT